MKKKFLFISLILLFSGFIFAADPNGISNAKDTDATTNVVLNLSGSGDGIDESFNFGFASSIPDGEFKVTSNPINAVTSVDLKINKTDTDVTAKNTDSKLYFFYQIISGNKYKITLSASPMENGDNPALEYTVTGTDVSVEGKTGGQTKEFSHDPTDVGATVSSAKAIELTVETDDITNLVPGTYTGTITVKITADQTGG